MGNEITHLHPEKPVGRAALMQSLRSGSVETLPAVERVLSTPASAAWVGTRITTFLRHYFEPDTDDREFVAMVSDWMDDLERFPQFAIEDAIADYRRNETRRPAPAAIVRRCVAIMAEIRGEVARVRQRAEEASEQRRPPTEEQRAAAQAIVAQFRRRAVAEGGE